MKLGWCDWLRLHFRLKTDTKTFIEIATPLFYLRIVHEGVWRASYGGLMNGLGSGIIWGALPVCKLIEGGQLYRYSGQSCMAFVSDRDRVQYRKRSLA